MRINRSLFVACMVVLCALASALNARAAAGHVEKTVKVFVLAGQSNMEGKGAVNTLAWLGEDPTYGHLLRKIRKQDGSWVECDDVFIDYLGRHGKLGVGYGSEGGPHGLRIGPEYGFGIAVGEAFEEPVLLIKTAWGGKDVANDFRAPSREGDTGPFYTQMIEHTREVLANMDSLFPELAGHTPELAGFVWFQGWNDMVNKEKTAAYTENLAAMLRDVRSDLHAPDLPIVIGELGVDGDDAKGNILTFRAAQAAVVELPEFKDSARFVRTAPYWDTVAHEMYKQDVWKGEEKDKFYRIASDRPYHYLGSGKIYFLMGWAFGREMVELAKAHD